MPGASKTTTEHQNRRRWRWAIGLSLVLAATWLWRSERDDRAATAPRAKAGRTEARAAQHAAGRAGRAAETVEDALPDDDLAAVSDEGLAATDAPPRPLPRIEPAVAWAPPTRLPPDPATHRPPMHNPGGVDGDRPPRPAPGLEPETFDDGEPLAPPPSPAAP